jgi:hypothetical protein
MMKHHITVARDLVPSNLWLFHNQWTVRSGGDHRQKKHRKPRRRPTALFVVPV